MSDARREVVRRLEELAEKVLELAQVAQDDEVPGDWNKVQEVLGLLGGCAEGLVRAGVGVVECLVGSLWEKGLRVW